MAVIDLDAVQARMEARQAVFEPKSSAQERRGLQPALVETLWQLMGSMYGTRWTANFGAAVDPDRVWTAALHGLDEPQIRSGLRRCVESGLEWPPSAPEFRALCVGPTQHWEHARIAAEDRRLAALPKPEVDRAAAREALNAIRASLGMAAR